MAHPVKFKVGDVAPDGNKIKSLYGETDTVLVFRSDSDALCHYIDVDEVAPKTAAALTEFERIRGLVSRVYPKESQSALQDELGASLFNSLTAADEARAVSSFGSLNERILKRAGNDARMQYTAAATGSAAVFTLLGWLYDAFYPREDLRVYGVCAAFAALGAFASVIFRIKDVEVDPLEDKLNVQSRGAFRIVVGVLFAAFLIAAAKANLVAGIATTTTASLLAYSFLCGFSERFAPDQLGGLEKPVAERETK